MDADFEASTERAPLAAVKGGAAIQCDTRLCAAQSRVSTLGAVALEDLGVSSRHQCRIGRC